MKLAIKTWQQELSEGFSNAQSLCDYLELSLQDYPILLSTDFSVRVPREFADRMEKGNINDPLLKQVLPLSEENTGFPGFSLDPVGDINAIKETGVIHKYQGRVLLITTGSCAINCRYCFRRNFPYADYQLGSQKITLALEYIKDNEDISEVILSGGDPLLLSDQKIFDLIQQLDKIEHLQTIRIHSRIPVVLPNRITTELCDFLASINKLIVCVIHSNHEKELNEKVKFACKKLTESHVTLLNQSVLLKGINDSAQQLLLLSEKLFSLGVMPYYLHLLDKAKGTGHFEVEEDKAIEYMEQIKRQLPGYLVPKLVRERAGSPYKIVIA